MERLISYDNFGENNFKKIPVIDISPIALTNLR